MSHTSPHRGIPVAFSLLQQPAKNELQAEGRGHMLKVLIGRVIILMCSFLYVGMSTVDVCDELICSLPSLISPGSTKDREQEINQ